MSNETLQNAQAWVKNQQWRIFRYTEWKYTFKRNTLIRWTQDFVQHSMFEEILTALNTEPIPLLTVENKALKGEWKPVRAWYEEGEKDKNGIRTVRVYQALRRVEAGDDDGPYLIEDGCRYKVSFTFYWEVTKIPEIPTSESGISYSLENIRKDDETGTFSCMLVKRERQIQEIPLYTDHKDVYKDTATREVQGIREGDAHEVDEEIPEAEGGVIHDKNVSKNEDCTHNTQRRVTTEKPVEGAKRVQRVGFLTKTISTTDVNQPPFTIPEVKPEAGKTVGYEVEVTPGGLNTVTTTETVEVDAKDIRAACGKTIFEHQDSKTDGGQKEALGEAPEPEEGVTVEYRSEVSESGLHTNTTITKNELPVEEAVIEKQRGYRYLRESVTHVHQKDFVLPTLTAERGKTVGYKVEKTPGDLENITLTTTTEVEAEQIREGCTQTIFQHQHTTTTGGEGEALGEAPEAEDGKITRHVSELSEFGTFANTVEETQELKVEKSHTTASADAFSSMAQQTDTHVKVAGADSVTFTVGKITTIQSEQTPGGLNTVTTRTEKAGEEWSKHYSFTDQQTTHHVFIFDNQKEIPSAPIAEGVVPWRFNVSVNRNRFGLYAGQMTWLLDAADASGNSVNNWEEKDIEETISGIHRLSSGRVIRWQKVITYNQGACRWDGTAKTKINKGKEGSGFVQVGRNSFRWKKVTGIIYTETDVSYDSETGVITESVTL